MMKLSFIKYRDRIELEIPEMESNSSHLGGLRMGVTSKSNYLAMRTWFPTPETMKITLTRKTVLL